MIEGKWAVNTIITNDAITDRKGSSHEESVMIDYGCFWKSSSTACKNEK
jgi:hypothetical protein